MSRSGTGPVEDSVAVFVVVDGPGYLPHAITALRSVRRFHPRAGYFLLGRFIRDDDDARALIERHGLDWVHVDLSSTFADTVSLRRHPLARPYPRISWPSECFWWLQAPAVFDELGFRYSGALDGDTLAVAPLDLDEVLGGDAPMAGVEKRDGQVNSGVLFMDNAALREADLLGAAVHLYRTARVCEHRHCTGFCRILGDQSLLQELERAGAVELRRVGNEYNHMLTWDETTYLDRNPQAPFAVDRSRIIHLLSKPWQPPDRLGRLNPVMRDGYRAWWAFARELWPDDGERTALFGPERTVELGPSLARLLRR